MYGKNQVLITERVVDWYNDCVIISLCVYIIIEVGLI